MKIFGLNITKAKKPVGRNKLIPNLLWPWAYDRGLTPESDYGAFMNAYRGWIYVCANKNAQCCASVPLRLYVGKQTTDPIKSHPAKKVSKERFAYINSQSHLAALPQVRKAVEIDEVTEHPILDLMRNVNNFMNYFSLFELTNLFQELCGNAYWYILEDKLGIPREIWAMPPQNMKVVPHKTEFISGYKFIKGFDEIDFTEESVIHFKYPDPKSMYYGKGPLSAVVDPYNIHQNINRYENFVFGNMGRIEGAFETDNELSQYEFDRLKEEIRQTFSGIENVGKSPLLEKGVKYKTYGLAPRDLSFMQGRKAVKEEIVNAYGQSMGLYDKDATRANATVASFTHKNDTVKPRLIRMEEKLNEKLTPKFDDKLFMSFDDPVPVDEELRLKEVETHLKTGYSSINMEREADNKESVDWGEIPILNSNLIPLGSRPEGGNGNGAGDEPPVSLESITEDLALAVLDRLRGRQQ